MNFLSLHDYFKSHWKRINHLAVHNWINNVVTFEIFEMHSRIFTLWGAPRWNPARIINLRLTFTWFKKFQISARLGKRNSAPNAMLPLWSHCCAKMYWGATGPDDFTDLAESNSSRNFGFTTSLRAMATCYSWIVLWRPAPDKIRWKTYLQLKVVTWQVLAITREVTRLISLATLCK